MSKPQLIFGVHPVLEAVKAGVALDKILVRKGSNASWLGELRRQTKELGIPLQEVPLEKLDRTVRGNHQGIVAWRSLIEYVSVEQLIPYVYEKGEIPLLVVLDRITDVRNLGAIARTAYCMGAHGIVVPALGMAQLNEEAMKSSAGALHHIPICRSHNLKVTLHVLKASGLFLAGANEKAEQPIWNANFSVPTALFMGSEEDGISPAYQALLDQQFHIPMQGEIGSMNVGAALAMGLYEVLRQRHGQAK
jgi:23S rRNA (guanosine2251-2'-O)-methyltransferase